MALRRQLTGAKRTQPADRRLGLRTRAAGPLTFAESRERNERKKRNSYARHEKPGATM